MTNDALFPTFDLSTSLKPHAPRGALDGAPLDALPLLPRILPCRTARCLSQMPSPCRTVQRGALDGDPYRTVQWGGL